VHVLTYSLGSQNEEREDVAIHQLHPGTIDVRGGRALPRARRLPARASCAAARPAPRLAPTGSHPPLPPSLPQSHDEKKQLTGDWLDLDKWYLDPKKRERSYAVKISKYLRARQQGIAT
jgi:hypothetical protein